MIVNLCKTQGCKNKQRTSKGRIKDTLCICCAGQRQRTGTAFKYKKTYPSMHKNPVWYTTQGYVETQFADVQVLVHRLVDSLTNGPLPKGFEIHHKDEIKTNNHWTNLQRMSESDHARLHATKRWDK